MKTGKLTNLSAAGIIFHGQFHVLLLSFSRNKKYTWFIFITKPFLRDFCGLRYSNFVNRYFSINFWIFQMPAPSKPWYLIRILHGKYGGRPTWSITKEKMWTQSLPSTLKYHWLHNKILKKQKTLCVQLFLFSRWS